MASCGELPVDLRCLAELGGSVAESSGAGENSLSDLAAMATAFVSRMKWCKRVERLFLGYCIEGVLGVFLARIEPAEPEVDRTLWVIVGDLPPAYLVCDDAKTPAEAVLRYVEEMEKSAAAARGERSVEGVIPMHTAGGGAELPMSSELADMLERRLRWLRRRCFSAIRKSDARMLRRPVGRFARIEDRLR